MGKILQVSTLSHLFLFRVFVWFSCISCDEWYHPKNPVHETDVHPKRSKYDKWRMMHVTESTIGQTRINKKKKKSVRHFGHEFIEHDPFDQSNNAADDEENTYKENQQFGTDSRLKEKDQTNQKREHS